MGCGPAPKKANTEKKQSPVGTLRVAVLGTEIYAKEKLTKPQLKVRVSNAISTTQNLAPPDPNNLAGDSFTFPINSFYKHHGRAIEVGLCDGNSLIAFGSVDANPSVEKGIQQQTRCILNKHGQQQQYGSVLLRSTFEQLPYHDLTFRFQQATIRRKTGSCGQDNVAARMTIGEQCLETQFLPDSLKNPPEWADHKYNFKVPDNIKEGLLELVDDRNNTIGSAKIDLDEYTSIKQGDELIETQTLFYNDNGKKINAGDLKFSYIAGKYADFKPRSQLMTSVMRAIRPQNQLTSTLLPRDKEKTEQE